MREHTSGWRTTHRDPIRENEGKRIEERTSNSVEDTRNAGRNDLQKDLTRESYSYACGMAMPNRTFLAPLTNANQARLVEPWLVFQRNVIESNSHDEII